jgi:3-dehydroquinate dehydratase/shikimate dehydrogenase
LGFELRLDYLHDFKNLEFHLRQMLLRLHSPQVIATCRREAAGGRFSGSVAEQVAVLQAAVRAGCHWVDLEVQSLDGSPSKNKQLLREFRPAKVLVSYHNYRSTPQLAPIYRRLARLPVQAVKVSTFARCLRDNLTIRKLLKAHRRRSPKLVALAMGPSGIPSRILALQSGSALTYASPGNNHPVASGQLALDTLRATYRVEHLTHTTRLYGVVGSLASMSLSPAMQNAAFQAKHIRAVYLPCETQTFSDFLAFARAMRFRGFSVTMPFKRAVIRSLDWIDPLAARIGACNTVAVEDGKWRGWNTDAAAVVEVLTKRLRLPGSRILILGAGGAARAAAFALRAQDAQVLVSARRHSAAERLARAVGGRVVPWGATEPLDVDALVNATPVGMPPYTESMPIELARFRVRVVFDMVYYPLETRLLTEARGRGLTAISGLEMLVSQGARQFEIWTGLAAPRALMEQAIRQALDYGSNPG